MDCTPAALDFAEETTATTRTFGRQTNKKTITIVDPNVQCLDQELLDSAVGLRGEEKMYIWTKDTRAFPFEGYREEDVLLLDGFNGGSGWDVDFLLDVLRDESTPKRIVIRSQSHPLLWYATTEEKSEKLLSRMRVIAVSENEF